MPRTKPRLVEVEPAQFVDLVDAKLRPPAPRPGTVPRTALVNRLRVGGAHPIVTVLAPAGYGKTTLLTQWADRERRAVAWVSLGEGDDDPAVLSQYVETAIGRAASSGRSGVGAGGSQGIVVVLDDVQVLRSRRCARVVTELAEHLPDGSTLVLAGRTLPRIPIARARAAGRVFELGADDLALSRREVDLLLRGIGAERPQSDVAELAERTEGWAVGVYLTASAPAEPSGRDRFLADYFDFESLSRLDPADVRFVTQTSVLDRLCGPLCDAVLETTGSAGKLESMAASNLFLFRLDRERRWYRYHRQFREFLRDELERREPELVRQLNERAAAWHEAQGARDDAIPYARAAGDVERAARLLGEVVPPHSSSGRAAAVEGLLGLFDDEQRLEQYPVVGVLGAWMHLIRGRSAAATRWLATAEGASVAGPPPDGSSSLEPWIAVVHAAMCRHGIEEMRADAERAVRTLHATSGWRPVALLLRGVAQLLLGRTGAGDDSLAEAAETADALQGATIRSLALAERSVLAATCGDEARAGLLAAQARDTVDEAQLRDDATSALALAVSARHGLRGGDLVRARGELTLASTLARRLSHSLPWLAVQVNLELARANVSLLDAPAAQDSLAAADEVLRRRPRLGSLVAQVQDVLAEASTLSDHGEAHVRPLTAAELRLLPLLSTHLSFREIAERLFVSRNTVKTQAISVYRKLDAASRSEAVARAVALGLVDTTVV